MARRGLKRARRISQLLHSSPPRLYEATKRAGSRTIKIKCCRVRKYYSKAAQKVVEPSVGAREEQTKLS